MAAIKGRVDAALMLLEDLQLDEEDSSTARYSAISGVKDELTTAKEMLDCRLDLIEKVDSSTVGWSAAAFYEKTNGLVLKPDSSKLWIDAEKAAQAKKKEKPFRYEPGRAPGKSIFQRSSRG